jgi:hypothetical protein
VSVFVVGFGFGFNPPIHVIAGVWTVVLVLTLGVTAAVALRGGPGKEMLVIDQADQTITLPARGRRREPLTIPLAAVERVQVARRSGRGSKGGRQITYVPTIDYTDQKGSPREAHLPRKYSRAAAEGLAAWIEEQAHRARRR